MKLEIIYCKTKMYPNNHEDSGSSYVFSTEEIKELGFKNRFPYCLLYLLESSKITALPQADQGIPLKVFFWNLDTVQVRMERVRIWNRVWMERN